LKKSGKEEVITELKKDNTYDGEQETALKKAISRMFDFVNGGGEEEELEEQGESVQHQITDIQSTFQEIKKIEQSMLALESSDQQSDALNHVPRPSL